MWGSLTQGDGKRHASIGKGPEIHRFMDFRPPNSTLRFQGDFLGKSIGRYSSAS
jgi:hypothetical protein